MTRATFRANVTPMPVDAGSAVLLALMVCVLLTTIGVMLAAVGDTERAIAGHFRASAETAYAAEGIAERVIADLASAPDWSPYLSGVVRSTFFDPGAMPVTAYGETLDVAALSASVQADADRTAIWGPNNPRWRLIASGPFAALTGSADSLAYGLAWLADDPDETDGDAGTDANRVVWLRARARGPSGAERDVLVTLARIECQEEEPCDGSASVRVLSWRATS